MTTLFFLALCALALVRNEIVYRVGMRRLNEIHAYNVACIRRGHWVQSQRAYEEFHAVSYEAMLFDLRRWTYRQFYPKDVG